MAKLETLTVQSHYPEHDGTFIRGRFIVFNLADVDFLSKHSQDLPILPALVKGSGESTTTHFIRPLRVEASGKLVPFTNIKVAELITRSINCRP